MLSDIGDTHFDRKAGPLRGCFVHPGLGPPPLVRAFDASDFVPWLCTVAPCFLGVLTPLCHSGQLLYSACQNVCTLAVSCSVCKFGTCAQWFSDAFSGPAECTSPGTFTHVLSELCSRNGVWCAIFSRRRHASADVQLTKPAKFVCTCAKVLCSIKVAMSAPD